MPIRSTDRGPSKGFGLNKILDGRSMIFYDTNRTGGGTNSPTYSVSPSTTSLNEGSSVTFTVSTNVPSGTTLYWSTNAISGTIDGSDFNDGVTTGSFIITNDTGSFSRTLANDATTEGSESFQIQIRTGSASGPIVATSSTITIGDTSLTPTYSVSPSTTSINEGSSVTFTVTTTNVSNGTTLYWSTNAISGTINGSDFNDGVTTGSFTINSNSGSITRTLASDVNTEGSESFQLQIRTGSTGGTIVATSSTVTINDTSVGFQNILYSSYNYSGSVFSFTAPGSVLLVDAYGAQGGTTFGDNGSYAGYNGGRIQAYIQVTPGETIYGLVGGQGTGTSGRAGGGGGGFTALWTGSSNPGSGTWLIGSGGGGGGAANLGGGILNPGTGGGGYTVTQSSSRQGGSGGSGINGGSAGGSGSTSGGGAGGNASGDNSGGGGGGGSGSAAGSGATTQYIGGSGGFGGGGGGSSGGSGGDIYRTAGAGGGGGGWIGGNGGAYASFGGQGAPNFYFSQTIPNIATQLLTSSSTVRSGNGYMEIRY
jgi:hypothetical protein